MGKSTYCLVSAVVFPCLLFIGLIIATGLLSWEAADNEGGYKWNINAITVNAIVMNFDIINRSRTVRCGLSDNCLYECYDGYATALFEANNKIYNHSSLTIECSHNYNDTISLLQEQLGTTKIIYYNRDNLTDNNVSLRSEAYIPFVIAASIIGIIVLIIILTAVIVIYTTIGRGSPCLSR